MEKFYIHKNSNVDCVIPGIQFTKHTGMASVTKDKLNAN